MCVAKGDSRRKELKKTGGVVVSTLDNLKNCDDGIPIYAKLEKNKSLVALSKPIHTLVLGSTGSGKTQTFVSPMIEILSRTKTKPSLVITDPKGELYKCHASGLESRGYSVSVLNLTDVYYSVRWNPFGNTIRQTKQLKEEHKIVQKDGYYLAYKKKCATYKEALQVLEITRREIEDKIRLDLSDAIRTAFPSTSQGEGKSWEEGAQGFILGVVMCMWEDLLNGVIEEQQFNLFNAFSIISNYANVDGDIELGDMKVYFENRNSFYGAKAAANAVLSATRNTLTSYLSTVHSYMRWLGDRGLQALTSESEIDFNAFDEQPNCLFIKIPDAQKERHSLVSLLVLQMYKSLVDKAGINLRNGDTKNEELKRTTYFILDEFGNMPKFESLDSIITVGRSRRIFMVPIIQDFKQLDNKYGKEVAGIVRNNCTTQIYIQSIDSETNEQFSKMVGNKKIRKTSSSASLNQNENVSYSVEEKPLITPNELRNLNDNGSGKLGTSIVLVQGKRPIKATYTPLFRVFRDYAIVEKELVVGNPKGFNDNALYFDIKTRQNKLDQSDKNNMSTEMDIGSDYDVENCQNYEDYAVTEDDEKEMLEALEVIADEDYDRNFREFIKICEGFKTMLDVKIYNQFCESNIKNLRGVIRKIITQAGKDKNHFLLYSATRALVFYEQKLLPLIRIHNSDNSL